MPKGSPEQKQTLDETRDTIEESKALLEDAEIREELTIEEELEWMKELQLIIPEIAEISFQMERTEWDMDLVNEAREVMTALREVYRDTYSAFEESFIRYNNLTAGDDEGVTISEIKHAYKNNDYQMDLLTAEPLGEQYYRDKHAIWFINGSGKFERYGSRSISNTAQVEHLGQGIMRVNDEHLISDHSEYKEIDAETAEVINRRHMKDKNSVYVLWGTYGNRRIPEPKVIEGADPETFELLVDNYNYDKPFSLAVDANGVYVNAEKLDISEEATQTFKDHLAVIDQVQELDRLAPVRFFDEQGGETSIIAPNGEKLKVQITVERGQSKMDIYRGEDFISIPLSNLLQDVLQFCEENPEDPENFFDQLLYESSTSQNPDEVLAAFDVENLPLRQAMEMVLAHTLRELEA